MLLRELSIFTVFCEQACSHLKLKLENIGLEIDTFLSTQIA